MGRFIACLDSPWDGLDVWCNIATDSLQKPMTNLPISFGSEFQCLKLSCHLLSILLKSSNPFFKSIKSSFWTGSIVQKVDPLSITPYYAVGTPQVTHLSIAHEPMRDDIGVWWIFFWLWCALLVQNEVCSFCLLMHNKTLG